MLEELDALATEYSTGPRAQHNAVRGESSGHAVDAAGAPQEEGGSSGQEGEGNSCKAEEGSRIVLEVVRWDLQSWGLVQVPAQWGVWSCHEPAFLPQARAARCWS